MTGCSARKATVAVFDTIPPQYRSPDGKERSWMIRGGNFVVCTSFVEPGAVLARQDEPEEYMVVIPPGGAAVTLEAGEEVVQAASESLTIVPPGGSRIRATSRGYLARIFSKAAEDLVGMSYNHAAYADGAPELAEPHPWPAPPSGFRLRHYPLDRYPVADGQRMQPRCFRSTNMMVNLFAPFHTRRGNTELSPHWHDDFEQASLCFSGTWVHHLRYNWGADASAWWPDDHAETPTPSVVIIPANAIHTSEDVGKDGPESCLYDIFCPPRLDFAAKKGFCLNEDEYPLPVHADASVIKTGGTLLSWQKPK